MKPNTKKRKRTENLLFKDARPDLFALIDRELSKKNEGLTDEQIDLLSHGSGQGLWFRCPKHTTCNEHIWHSNPKRACERKIGCPFCNPVSRKFVCKCDPRLLKTQCPGIFCQIDRELTKKHENLTDSAIDRLLFGSRTQVYFKCPSHITCSKHVWKTTINSRTRPVEPTNCPYCTKSGEGKRTCECSSLYSMFPLIAANWDYITNEQLGPKEVTPKSNRLVNWNCKTCDHRWQMKIAHCTRLVRGCPNCSQLAKESVGAHACRQMLTDMKKTFDSEATLHGLRLDNELRFDFLCTSQSNEHDLLVGIEYDGPQHFIYTPLYYRTLKDFKKGHSRDRIKNRFCGENRIHLLRIAYSIPTNKISNVIRRFFARIETATAGQTFIQYVGKEYNQDYFKEW